jgi:transcriptional/translational regulatory protein YebC/TACO1
VPKTNIDNILKKASAKDAANFEEKIYEVSDLNLSLNL